MTSPWTPELMTRMLLAKGHQPARNGSAGFMVTEAGSEDHPVLEITWNSAAESNGHGSQALWAIFEDLAAEGIVATAMSGPQRAIIRIDPYLTDWLGETP